MISNFQQELDGLSMEELEARAKAMLELAQEKRRLRDESLRADLIELQSQKAALLSEVQEIEAKIRAVNAQLSSPEQGNTDVDTKITDAIEDFVREKGVADSKELRKHLESLGLNTENQGQMVGYLKRQGRIKSAGWGKYQLCETEEGDVSGTVAEN